MEKQEYPPAEGLVVGATEAVIERGSGKPHKAFVAKNIAEMQEWLEKVKATRQPLAILQFNEENEVVGITDVDETRLKTNED